MEEILIIGNGGFAKEVAFLIDFINMKSRQWKILGYIAKDEIDVGKQNGKYSVFGSDAWLQDYGKHINIAFGLGDPATSAIVSSRLQGHKNISFPNLIHPNAIGDWERIKMGQGNIICAGNIFTTDIEIGSFNIFNLSCTVGHDAVISDYNVFNPTVNVSGGVKMGNKNLVGTGVQILQFLAICDNNQIGAGAVVNKNIIETGTYVGVPAKKIK